MPGYKIWYIWYKNEMIKEGSRYPLFPRNVIFSLKEKQPVSGCSGTTELIALADKASWLEVGQRANCAQTHTLKSNQSKNNPKHQINI